MGTGEDEIEIEAAAESGSVAHCNAPNDVPCNVSVVKPAGGKLRNVIGASGEGIENYGEA